MREVTGGPRTSAAAGGLVPGPVLPPTLGVSNLIIVRQDSNIYLNNVELLLLLKLMHFNHWDLNIPHTAPCLARLAAMPQIKDKVSIQTHKYIQQNIIFLERLNTPFYKG